MENKVFVALRMQKCSVIPLNLVQNNIECVNSTIFLFATFRCVTGPLHGLPFDCACRLLTNHRAT